MSWVPFFVSCCVRSVSLRWSRYQSTRCLSLEQGLQRVSNVAA